MRLRLKMTRKLKDLNSREFTEILLTFMVGNTVRAFIAEAREEDEKQIEEQLNYIINLTEELGHNDLIEEFEGVKLPTSALCLEEEKIREEYDDQEFWENLEVRLGQRDFYKSLTTSERKKVNKNLWLPEKVHSYYEKYRKEFEKNGIERLRIIDKEIVK